MTRKYKIYKPYIITLLLCFLQVAGIDVYAQEPVKVTPHDSVTVREAPKARAGIVRPIVRQRKILWAQTELCSVEIVSLHLK